MNKGIEEKITQLLESDAINYLETSERLILKNMLDKNTHSKIELENTNKIIVKYSRFIKN